MHQHGNMLCMKWGSCVQQGRRLRPNELPSTRQRSAIQEPKRARIREAHSAATDVTHSRMAGVHSGSKRAHLDRWEGLNQAEVGFLQKRAEGSELVSLLLDSRGYQLNLVRLARDLVSGRDEDGPMVDRRFGPDKICRKSNGEQDGFNIAGSRPRWQMSRRASQSSFCSCG